MKGGAQLYSNLGWLYGAVLSGDGPPTQGMREAAKRLNAELGKPLERVPGPPGQGPRRAEPAGRTLELPHIIVPPVKRSRERMPSSSCASRGSSQRETSS